MHFLKSLTAQVVGVCCLLNLAQAHSTQRNPIERVSILDDAVINTPSHRVHSLSSFDITFPLSRPKQRLKLSLSPNHDVIAEGATVQILAADGTVKSEELIDRSEHKVFMGSAWLQHYHGADWANVGWARVLVHEDGAYPIFEGAFSINGDAHHIQTRTNYVRTKLEADPEVEVAESERMVVWRDSDIRHEDHAELRRRAAEQAACTSDDLDFNTQPEHPVYLGIAKRTAEEMKQETSYWGTIKARSLLMGRQSIDGQLGGNGAGVNLVNTIGSTAGCPSTRKVALIGVATDCTYTATFNSTASARANIISQINTASGVYEGAFNISLGIQNLTINEATCPGTASSSAPWNVPCGGGVDIQQRLNLFSAWRGNRTDNNAWWTLLSTCNTGSAIGLAWLGQACVGGSSTASNETVAAANFVVKTNQEWQVIAHESGHTLGAVHDCTSQTCADGKTVAASQCCPLSSSTCDAGGRYIMNPASMPNVKQFSPCSIGNICSALLRNSVKSTCLVANRDVTTITGSQCGNGIVESGEECDCGGPSGCGANSCCNPTTCKLTAGSQCDPSNEDCCTSQCKFAASGQVCRASTGVCDPQEVCSGANATCPADQTAPDGTACGANNSTSLTCASGQCTSRDLQCKTLMGSYTQGNDTYACDNTNCQISCASPQFGSNVCYSMKQNFLDGTTCGGGGKCQNGVCQGSSVGGEILSWIDSNKTLVIALCSAIGGLILLSVLGCIWRCCRRRKQPKVVPMAMANGWASGPPRGRNNRAPWVGNVPPPPPMQSNGRWGAPGYNGYNGYNNAPPQQMWRQPTVRYA